MISIFKLDSKGKLRTITYETDGAKLIQHSGIVGSENLVRAEKVCKPKNVGKTNEVLAPDQAHKEMMAKIAGKIKGEYFMSENSARADTGTIYPMLAKVYEKESRKINWKGGVFVQPKLDGIRCLATVTNEGAIMKSREGTIIDTLPHVLEALRQSPNGIYDGELYAHGLNFQENTRLIKKDRGSDLISLHLYDMPSDDAFQERYTKLIKNEMAAHTRFISIVPTTKISTEAALKAFHLNCLNMGYEGAMVRWGEDGYKSKGRSSNLLKYKRFDDDKFMVIDIIPSDARPEQGVIVCAMHGGVSFKASLKGSHAEREKMLSEKLLYIGRMANIRYFGKSEKGIPRFPVCVEFTDI